MKTVYKLQTPKDVFHVCTDGTSAGMVHTCPEDYYRSVIISAVIAYRYRVRILCFCHMSSHSHYVISCASNETAKTFIEAYKREYARYLSKEREIAKAYNDVGVFVSQITDYKYLRNCISYVLLNPVVAGICKSPEEYPYSSFDAYFSDRPLVGKDVSEMRVRQSIRLFKTNQDLSKSGFRIDEENHLALKSFIDYTFVETLFGNRTWFFKSLALTNSADEEMKYAPQSFRFSDMDIVAEVLEIAADRFGKAKLPLLTHDQKISMIPAIQRRTHATNKRIARILRLPSKLVDRLLGNVEECR